MPTRLLFSLTHAATISHLMLYSYRFFFLHWAHSYINFLTFLTLILEDFHSHMSFKMKFSNVQYKGFFCFEVFWRVLLKFVDVHYFRHFILPSSPTCIPNPFLSTIHLFHIFFIHPSLLRSTKHRQLCCCWYYFFVAGFDKLDLVDLKYFINELLRSYMG